jgi:hypothetical protein
MHSEPSESGPGPMSRVLTGPQAGRSTVARYVGDYPNPILKPMAAEIVKKRGEIELSCGIARPQLPMSRCRPASPGERRDRVEFRAQSRAGDLNALLTLDERDARDRDAARKPWPPPLSGRTTISPLRCNCVSQRLGGTNVHLPLRLALDARRRAARCHAIVLSNGELRASCG